MRLCGMNLYLALIVSSSGGEETKIKPIPHPHPPIYRSYNAKRLDSFPKARKLISDRTKAQVS